MKKPRISLLKQGRTLNFRTELSISFQRFHTQIFSVGIICFLFLLCFLSNSFANSEKNLTQFSQSLSPFNIFEVGHPKRVLDKSFRGKYAMRWENGYIGFNTESSWLGFDTLAFDAFLPGEQDALVTMEIKDDQSRDYWTRVNQSFVIHPGFSTVKLPIQLYVGEKSRPGRALRIDKIRSVIFSRNGESSHEPLFLGDLSLIKNAIQPPTGILAFDFGTEASPIFPGMLQFTKSTRYTKTLGYGITHGKVWEPYPQASYVLQPDSLYSDCLLLGDAEIAVDLPNGKYQVFMNIDYAGGYWGEFPYYRVRRVFANNKPVLIETLSATEARRKFYQFAEKDDYWKEDVFEKYLSEIFHEKTFEVQVNNGQLKLRFDGGDCASQPCFGIALSALIIIPEGKLEEGNKYLGQLREKRKEEFNNNYKKTLAQTNKIVEAKIPNGKDILLFPKDIMESLPQNSIPPIQNLGQPVKGFSALGETQAVSFGVYPLQQFKNVMIKVSHLRDPVTGAIIPAHQVELGWISYRLKRLTPDGSQYTLSEKYIRKDSKSDLQANTMSRVWASIQVPENAQPGIYHGEFKLLLSSGETRTLPIEFRVFNVHLEKLDFPVGPFNSNIIENYWLPEELKGRNKVTFLSSLQKMREVGLTSFSFSPKVGVSFRDDQMELNVSEINEVMLEARKQGFLGLVGYGEIIKGFHTCKDDPRTFWLQAHSDKKNRFYAEFTRRLTEQSIKNHWLPLVLIGCDEPLENEYKDILDRAKVFAEASTPQVQWTMTFSLTPQGGFSHSLYRDIAALLPFPLLNQFKGSALTYLKESQKSWGYYNDANRNSFGFEMFNLRNSTHLNHRIAWNWNQNSGNPYFSLDGREDDENWCNGTFSGNLMCTVFLDRHIRTGLSDYRFALTLKKQVEEATRKLNPRVVEGKRLLKEVEELEPVLFSYSDVDLMQKYSKTHQLKLRIAEYLEKSPMAFRAWMDKKGMLQAVQK